jgi:hypothetical protein
MNTETTEKYSVFLRPALRPLSLYEDFPHFKETIPLPVFFPVHISHHT